MHCTRFVLNAVAVSGMREWRHFIKVWFQVFWGSRQRVVLLSSYMKTWYHCWWLKRDCTIHMCVIARLKWIVFSFLFWTCSELVQLCSVQFCYGDVNRPSVRLHVPSGHTRVEKTSNDVKIKLKSPSVEFANWNNVETSIWSDVAYATWIHRCHRLFDVDQICRCFVVNVTLSLMQLLGCRYVVDVSTPLLPYIDAKSQK